MDSFGSTKCDYHLISKANVWYVICRTGNGGMGEKYAKIIQNAITINEFQTLLSELDAFECCPHNEPNVSTSDVCTYMDESV